MSTNYRVWNPSNVYPSAEIADDVSIGAFTEIGPNVHIGTRTRIGAHCFIPEGVTIGEHCFVGPCCCFTNDRFPPSPKAKWEETIIKNGARIGAGCVILPGITIGEGALIGAGSVVTKDVPPGETWAGNPARKLQKPSKP